MLRKIFKHRLVPVTDLKTETINGQRHYVLPDGVTKLKSVTSIISDKMDKTALLEWKAKVGEEEAKKISTQAARRGTAIHSIAERYVLNEENYFLDNEMPTNKESFKPIKKILDEHVDNILGIEVPLYSTALKCAGRTDLVAEYDGVLSVIDFKTSKKMKKADWIENYFIQSTVYAMMFEWIYKFSVPQIVVVITVDHESDAQVFKLERSQFVNRTIELFTS